MTDSTDPAPRAARPDVERVLPIVQEEAFVTKRTVETEHVRVRTSMEEHQVTVRDTVARERIEIRRVAVDREVAQVPAIREEDGVTIVPVVEERLVVEKRLFLVEEIHLVRAATAEAIQLPTTLRRTRVDIDRTNLEDEKEDVNGRS